MTEHPVFELDTHVRGSLHIGNPCELPTFREFNFVYGVNGSGKTTLAAAIAEAGRENGCKVNVFDREYVRAVLADVGNVDTLWVVADSASDLVARKVSLHEKREILRSALSVSEAQLETSESRYAALLSMIGDELRPLKRLVKVGTATYSEREVQQKFEAIQNARTTQARTDRAQARTIVEQPDLTSLKPFRVHESQNVLARLLRFLETGDFASLQQTGLSEWATNAAAVASSAEGRPCPFCSQVLTLDAIDHIQSVATQPPPEGEDFEAFRASFEQVRTRSLSLSLPDPGSFHAPLKQRAGASLRRYATEMATLAALLPSINDAIEILATESDGSHADLWTKTARAAESALADLVTSVDEHESAVEDQQSRKSEAFDEYEQSLLREHHKHWADLRNTHKKRETDVERIAEEISAIEAERDEVDRNIRGQMSPVRLNADLESYLGHTAIRFEISNLPEDPPGYRIVRSSGEPAKNLSEGERTAIALLHFLRDCANEDAAHPPDLVILDDPVTSLDDSALYTAHAFIESSLRRPYRSDGPTVVVLTHRHPYFRLLVDWRSRLNKEFSDQERRDRAGLMETFSILGGEERLCMVREMPESLATSGSEYALLFAKLMEYSSDGSATDHCEWSEPIYVAIQPNLARRVLEGFLSFKYSGTKRKPPRNLLEEALSKDCDETFGADREARLWKLLHAGSHGDGLVDTYDPVASSAEIQLVVRDVLDLIKALDPIHFESFTLN